MDTQRYSRQVILPQVGEEGQHRLSRACALIVGCGALGSASAHMLVRAGVGRVILVDRDVVETGNIHRQMFTEDDVGLPKADALASHLRRVNLEVRIEPVCTDLGPENVEEVVGPADVLLDGCDNMETRYMLNDASVKHGIPWVYAGAVGTQGMCAIFAPGGACFRCLFPTRPPAGSLDTCETAGVLNTLTFAVSAFESTLALRWLLGRRPPEELLVFDAWEHSLQKISFRRRAGCRCCGLRDYEHLVRRGARHAVLCGRNAVHVSPRAKADIDTEALAVSLRAHGRTRCARGVCSLELPDGISLTVFSDGRAIVSGTDDIARARSIYSRYVGD